MGALAPIPLPEDTPRWDPIPESCLGLLPFSAEPLSEWNEDSDLCAFLVGMHSSEYTAVAESGERFAGSYSEYGRTLFFEGRQSGGQEAAQFARPAANALPGPSAAEENIEPVPDFTKDASFGRAWKSRVAWKAITGQVLSESAFFSIAHTLEAEADLDASVLLASHLYYKHALQTLRTMVEDVVIPLYFYVEPAQFQEWRACPPLHPALRGKEMTIWRPRAAAPPAPRV